MAVVLVGQPITTDTAVYYYRVVPVSYPGDASGAAVTYAVNLPPQACRRDRGWLMGID